MQQKPTSAAPHPGDALVQQMMINLTANNRDPERLEAQLDARDIARAEESTTTADTPPESAT